MQMSNKGDSFQMLAISWVIDEKMPYSVRITDMNNFSILDTNDFRIEKLQRIFKHT